MSTSLTDNNGANRVFANLTATSNRNNSAAALENGMASSSPSSTSPASTTEATEVTWINSFTRFDRIFSGSLLHFCYRFIDMIILFIGLSSYKSSCKLSNRLAMTSIFLLIFHFIDLTIVFLLFFRNISSSRRQMTEEEKSEQLRRASGLRGFFMFFKLIPVCLGTSYAFASASPATSDCEVMRFCLGVVCLSTLLIMIIPPTKPDLPARRSLIMECFILIFLLIINGTYLGTVASAMKGIEQPSCIYKNSDDLYFGAPLKSYAYVGLVLFSCTTAIHIINLFVNQLCMRLPNGRRLYSYYYALQYTLNYFGALIVIYYFSVGALFLFQPRSGQPCRTDAPGLYRTLITWEWIRILSPLIAVPLVLVLCCLGVFVGIVLSYCLPASITVPLLELLRGWLSAAPVQINPNPPATQDNIDALPMVAFGQEPDQFNQIECAICRANFEANEPVKKLQCGHFFHSECVTNWLLITRICPICRRRLSATN